MKIAGIDVPDQEQAKIGLTRIFGIGQNNVFQLLKQVKIKPDKRVRDFTKEEVAAVIKALEDFKTEGDLKKKITDDIARLRAIRTYRGIRHILNLPARGQRTKTNARTRKGAKKTVGALTKEMWAKLETQQREAIIKK